MYIYIYINDEGKEASNSDIHNDIYLVLNWKHKGLVSSRFTRTSSTTTNSEQLKIKLQVVVPK